jgi:hypothetical protein
LAPAIPFIGDCAGARQSDAEFLIHKMFELRTLLFHVLNLWEFITQIKRIKYI